MAPFPLGDPGKTTLRHAREPIMDVRRGRAPAVLLVLLLAAPGLLLLPAAHAAAPEPPTNARSVPGPGAGEIHVAWDAPAGAPAGLAYEVIRCASTCASPVGVGGNLTFTDRGLPPDAGYHHRVRAVSPGGVSAWVSTPTSVTFDLVPREPASRPGAGAGDITVSWRPPAQGAAGLRYEVIRCGSTCTAPLLVGANLSHVDGGLPPDTSHYHRVRAVDANGHRSAWVSTPTSVTFDLVPREPASRPGPDAGGITLSWRAPAHGATGLRYEVIRCASTCTPAILVGANLTYADARLAPDAGFHHRVRAIDANGHRSAWVSTPTSVTFDLAPRNVGSVAGPGAGETTATWEPPARGAAGLRYELVRCASTCTPAILVGTNLTYTDTRLPPDASFYHRVRAVDALGHASPWVSSPTSTTFGLVPTNASSANGPGAGDVLVTWQAPPRGEKGLRYELIRCASSCTSPILVGTNLTYLDAALPPDASFYHRVRSVDAAGHRSAWVSTPSVTTHPLTPRNVSSVSGPLPGQITVSWRAPAAGATGLGYEVVRCASTCTAPVHVGGNLTFTSTHLDPAGAFYHRVRAVDPLGRPSAWVSTATTQPAGPAGEPAPPAATDLRWVEGPKAGQVTLRWDLAGNASATTLTRVWTRGCGTCEPHVLATLRGATAYVEETRAPGSTRSYAVSLLNQGGESARTPWLSVRAPAPAPTVVTVAPEPAEGGLRLQWNAPAGPAEGVLGFRILRGCSGCALAPFATVSADVFRYDDRDVAPGGRMVYAVAPILAGGLSATSPARLGVAPVPLPVGLATAPSADGSAVNLTWRAPEKAAGSVVGYVIQRRLDATGPAQPFGYVPAPQTRFADATLPPGKSARYSLVAVTDAGSAHNATWRTAAPPALAPRYVTATPDASGLRVNLSWLPPSPAAGRVVSYRVAWQPCPACEEQALLVVPAGTTRAVLQDGLQTRGHNLTVRALTDNGPGAATNVTVPLRIEAHNLAVLRNAAAWTPSGAHKDLLYDCPSGPCGRDLQAWPAPNAGVHALQGRVKVCDYSTFNDNATYGCVECVDLVRGLSGYAAPVTTWTKGPDVMAGGVAPGTVVATFRGAGNTYPVTPPYGHVAVFAGYEPDGRGIRLWSMNWGDGDDSYVREHVVRVGSTDVTNALRYAVVQVPRGSFVDGA